MIKVDSFSDFNKKYALLFNRIKNYSHISGLNIMNLIHDWPSEPDSRWAQWFAEAALNNSFHHMEMFNYKVIMLFNVMWTYVTPNLQMLFIFFSSKQMN